MDYLLASAQQLALLASLQALPLLVLVGPLVAALKLAPILLALELHQPLVRLPAARLETILGLLQGAYPSVGSVAVVAN